MKCVSFPVTTLFKIPLLYYRLFHSRLSSWIHFTHNKQTPKHMLSQCQSSETSVFTFRLLCVEEQDNSSSSALSLRWAKPHYSLMRWQGLWLISPKGLSRQMPSWDAFSPHLHTVYENHFISNFLLRLDAELPSVDCYCFNASVKNIWKGGDILQTCKPVKLQADSEGTTQHTL